MGPSTCVIEMEPSTASGGPPSTAASGTTPIAPSRPAGGRCQEQGPALRKVFAGEPRQVAEIRRWVAAVLPPYGAVADAQAVATELAANAIWHTASGRGGTFAVEIRPCRDVIRVAVADAGGPADPQVIDDPAAERGRGLLLVRGLSFRMGVEGGRSGRVVWADVAVGGPDAVAHARGLLVRTTGLDPSVPKPELIAAIRQYRAALHALAVARFPPR
jgi:serine/threonine-protein kinase RsbW